MATRMMTKEAKLRIVIGTKKPRCLSSTNQPRTWYFTSPVSVRVQEGGRLSTVEYINRMYVAYNASMSKGKKRGINSQDKPRTREYL